MTIGSMSIGPGRSLAAPVPRRCRRPARPIPHCCRARRSRPSPRCTRRSQQRGSSSRSPRSWSPPITPEPTSSPTWRCCCSTGPDRSGRCPCSVRWRHSPAGRTGSRPARGRCRRRRGRAGACGGRDPGGDRRGRRRSASSGARTRRPADVPAGDLARRQRLTKALRRCGAAEAYLLDVGADGRPAIGLVLPPGTAPAVVVERFAGALDRPVDVALLDEPQRRRSARAGAASVL